MSQSERRITAQNLNRNAEEFESGIRVPVRQTEETRVPDPPRETLSWAKDFILKTSEDRQEFERLRQGLHDSLPGADSRLIESVAVTTWRLQRIERMIDELDREFAETFNGKSPDSE